jgi:hypothetical protein
MMQAAHHMQLPTPVTCVAQLAEGLGHHVVSFAVPAREEAPDTQYDVLLRLPGRLGFGYIDWRIDHQRIPGAQRGIAGLLPVESAHDLAGQADGEPRAARVAAADAYIGGGRDQATPTKAAPYIVQRPILSHVVASNASTPPPGLCTVVAGQVRRQRQPLLMVMTVSARLRRHGSQMVQ